MNGNTKLILLFKNHCDSIFIRNVFYDVVDEIATNPQYRRHGDNTITEIPLSSLTLNKIIYDGIHSVVATRYGNETLKSVALDFISPEDKILFILKYL